LGERLGSHRLHLPEVLTHDPAQPVGARPAPVTLQLARQSQHRDRRRSGLDHSLHGRLVRHPADAADRIGDEVHLVAVAQRIEGREGDADLGPQAGDDELLAPSSLDRRSKVGVLPGIHRRPVDLGHAGQRLAQLGVGARHAVPHVDRAQDHGQLERRRHPPEHGDVGEQLLVADRRHARVLLGLVIDQRKHRVLRCQQCVGLRVSDWCGFGHAASMDVQATADRMRDSISPRDEGSAVLYPEINPHSGIRA